MVEGVAEPAASRSHAEDGIAIAGRAAGGGRHRLLASNGIGAEKTALKPITRRDGSMRL